MVPRGEGIDGKRVELADRQDGGDGAARDDLVLELDPGVHFAASFEEIAAASELIHEAEEASRVERQPNGVVVTVIEDVWIALAGSERGTISCL